MTDSQAWPEICMANLQEKYRRAEYRQQGSHYFQGLYFLFQYQNGWNDYQDRGKSQQGAYNTGIGALNCKQGQGNSQKRTEYRPPEGGRQAGTIAQGSLQGPAFLPEQGDDGNPDYSHKYPNLGTGYGVVLSQAGFGKDHTHRLSKGGQEGIQIAQLVITADHPFDCALGVFSAKHRQGYAGSHHGHTKQSTGSHGFSKENKAKKGRHGWRHGQEQHGYPGADHHIGTEQKDVCYDKADKARQGQEQPGPGTGIQGQGHTPHKYCSYDEKPEGKNKLVEIYSKDTYLL